MINKMFVPIALCALAVASPAMAANVAGTTTATFVNAQPTDTTYTGLGINHVTWGATYNDPANSVNQMTFAANSPFAAVTGQNFKIGSLSYYNGTTGLDTNPTSIGLNLAFNFTNPAIGATSSLFTLGLVTTPNTGDPDGDADYVYFPSMTSSTNFNVDGQNYTFKLLGFQNVVGDGFLSSDAREFHVREGGNASADLFGVLTAGAVPEPTSWAMMIVGFGAVGGVLRHRKSKVSFA